MPLLQRPDGTRIFYRLTGRDTGLPPLVFVHGWCSRHEHWEHQLRYFRRHHRILLLDRRGHGRSSTSGLHHDVAGHAADIAAVVKAAGLKRVVVIGHAGGSPGTLEFIRTHPRLVRAGIIIDGFLYTAAQARDPGNPIGGLFAALDSALRGKDARRQFRECYTRFFNARGDKAGIRQLVSEAALTADSVKLAELEGLRVDVTLIAEAIQCPMLWLTAGLQDQTRIARHFSHVGFAQTYGAAHFPQWEQPAQTNAMIEAFLARI